MNETSTTLRRLSALQRRGLRRLGTVYHPRFVELGGHLRMESMLPTFPRADRLLVGFLLWVCAWVPFSWLRWVRDCERPGVSDFRYRLVAFLHIQLKAMIYVLAYCDSGDGPNAERISRMEFEG